MFKVLKLLPLMAILGLAHGQLSDFEMLQQCSGKSGDIIAYPADKTKFIVCLDDQAVAGTCRDEPDPADATGTTTRLTCFSESKQKCSYDYCPAGPDSLDVDYEKQVAEICKNDDNAFRRLTARNCEKYYICLGSNSNPTYVLADCTAGLHFSRTTGKCEQPHVAGCQNVNTMCSDKKFGDRFAGSNCYEYYECIRKQPFKFTCEYGKHFEPITGKCISMEQSQCVDSSNRLPTCKTDDNGLYFKHPKCDRFYVCVNTVPLEATCPQNFYFDDKNRMCKRDNAGICRDSV